MKRRSFLRILAAGLLGLMGLAWLYRDKHLLLWQKLKGLGFEVEEEEVERFWKAWKSQRWGAKGKIWKYYVLVFLQYPAEPRDETVKLFLLSSNIWKKADHEKIRFLEIYYPYKRTCAHPFADLS